MSSRESDDDKNHKFSETKWTRRVTDLENKDHAEERYLRKLVGSADRSMDEVHRRQDIAEERAIYTGKHEAGLERNVLESGVPAAAIVLIGNSSMLLHHRVETAQVFVASQSGDVRGLHLHAHQVLEVDAFEPHVDLHQLGTTSDHTETLGGLVVQQLADEGHGLVRKVRGELDDALHDACVGLHWVVGEEGWIGGQHFECQDTEGPPIHALGQGRRERKGIEMRTKTMDYRFDEHKRRTMR